MADEPHSSGDKLSVLTSVGAFAVDTIIIYVLAMRISMILVGRWFAWVLPLLGISTTVRPADWYLQHLELVTIIPALAAGYIDIGRIVPALFGGLIREKRATSAAAWACIIPTIVLIYNMLQYHPPSSLLIHTSSVSVWRYFFDIQRKATLPNLFSADRARLWLQVSGTDFVRLWLQMSVTAPFYAGVAYSLGSILGRYRVLNRVVGSRHVDEALMDEDGEHATPGSPSSSPG